MKTGLSLDLFCRVIDYFGDAGVCWRLARQLVNEHAFQVRLWVDRLDALQKICPEVKAGQDEQQVAGVTVRHWPEPFPDISPASIPDAVVEGFGCRLPDNYVSAMLRCPQAPVWINMEYLSAESWVHDCHGVASLQSSVPLTKYFFFPGFTAETGGLFREAGLLERRRLFQQDAAGRRAFLKRLDVDAAADCVASLFCYDHAPVAAWFELLARQREKQVCCLVPEGVASRPVSLFLGRPAVAGSKRTEGALTVQVIPMVDQDAYDRLLWSCDFNFVRGEDSFVRAQWAARPFVWQIYPQDEAAHLPKLEAFLGRYVSDMPPALAEKVKKAWRAWNRVPDGADMAAMWEIMLGSLPDLTRYGVKWADELARREDFASSLVRFIHNMR